MEVEPKQIQNYQRLDGKEPFTDWLNGLRDVKPTFRTSNKSAVKTAASDAKPAFAGWKS